MRMNGKVFLVKDSKDNCWMSTGDLKIDHFSTHTMRKTFGVRAFKAAGSDASMALVRLQTLFNHASPSVTKVYLGITQNELESTYDLLDF